VPRAAGHRSDFNRWQFRFFALLAFAVFVGISLLDHRRQIEVPIRPAGPLPAVNIP
jgi:hypothetical protein